MEFPWVRPVNLFATMTFMNLVAVNDLCILSILTPFYASATLSHCPLAAYSNIPRNFFLTKKHLAKEINLLKMPT